MATQGEKPGQPGALTKTAPRDAGAGKTLSVRRYSCWHELGPLLQAARHHFTEGRDRADWHTLL